MLEAGKTLVADNNYLISLPYELKEIEDQISNNGLGVGHLVIDADVQKDVADKRREKNIEATLSFRIKSKLVRLNIHYLVPRVEEDNSWLVDETL